MDYSLRTLTLRWLPITWFSTELSELIRRHLLTRAIFLQPISWAAKNPPLSLCYPFNHSLCHLLALFTVSFWPYVVTQESKWTWEKCFSVPNISEYKWFKQIRLSQIGKNRNMRQEKIWISLVRMFLSWFSIIKSPCSNVLIAKM